VDRKDADASEQGAPSGSDDRDVETGDFRQRNEKQKKPRMSNWRSEWKQESCFGEASDGVFMAGASMLALSFALAVAIGLAIGFSVAALRASKNVIEGDLNDFDIANMTDFNFPVEDDAAVSLIAKVVASLFSFMLLVLIALTGVIAVLFAASDQDNGLVPVATCCMILIMIPLLFLVPPAIFYGLANDEISWNDFAKVWAVIAFLGSPFTYRSKDHDHEDHDGRGDCCRFILGVGWFALVGFIINRLSIFVGIYDDPFDVGDKVGTIFGVFYAPYLVPFLPLFFPQVFPLAQ